MTDHPDEQTEPMGDILPPPLKWAGGKRWLVPRLLALFDNERRLVEPFVGGMAVALGLRPERALLADINPHVINFYRCLAAGLRLTQEMQNQKEGYYKARLAFNLLLQQGREESEEAAQLFYYLNRTGYNGLCRFNNSGLFNVPFGQYKTVRYARDFEPYRLLRRWEFRCCDFEQLSLAHDDFLYADPPYDVEFTKYSKDDFGWEDQVRLAKWLHEHSGPVVASNQATGRILELYRSLGFAVSTTPAPRRISCTGDRRPATEMIATRNI